MTRFRLLSATAVACLLAASGCSYGTFSAPEYLGVVISPRPASIPAGGTFIFTGTVTNNLSLPQWSLLDAANTPSAGSLSAVAGSNTTILYTAPAVPPIYNNVSTTGITQGTVTLDASATAPPQSHLPVAHDAVTFYITAATVSAGISPATITVPLGTSFQFAGYAVGTTNNALTWQVQGVTGGSTSSGTISASGVYTAPLVLPVGGAAVTITVISKADSTKSASAVATLQ